LTVADAAEYLSMSRGAVYNLLRCGELRSIHIGRSRRIVLADLWTFVDQRTVGV
jgi:excisionase family DNA binding protein